jgi:hypothetical protein
MALILFADLTSRLVPAIVDEVDFALRLADNHHQGHETVRQVTHAPAPYGLDTAGTHS